MSAPSGDIATAAPGSEPRLEQLSMTRPPGFKAVRIKELREKARGVNPAVVEFVRGIERGGESPGSAAYSYAASFAAKGVDMPTADLAWVMLQMRKEAKKSGGEMAAALTVLEEIYAVLSLRDE